MNIWLLIALLVLFGILMFFVIEHVSWDSFETIGITITVIVFIVVVLISTGGVCKSCNTYNSSDHDDNYCKNCGEEYIDIIATARCDTIFTRCKKVYKCEKCDIEHDKDDKYCTLCGEKITFVNIEHFYSCEKSHLQESFVPKITD